jgi:hypothetical protein
MAKAKKTTTKIKVAKKQLGFWGRVERGVGRLFSTAFPKRGR